MSTLSIEINELVYRKSNPKYNLFNEEILWLDEAQIDFVSFVCNSYNYDRIYKNLKGLIKFIKWLRNKKPELNHCNIYLANILFDRNGKIYQM